MAAAGSAFTVALPVNPLEPRGLEVARAVRRGLGDAVSIVSYRTLSTHLPGLAHPTDLVDASLQLPGRPGSTGPPPPPRWTHEMVSVPQYQGALNATMSHFDAGELIAAAVDRELTREERETLDGCKILQDLVRSLDRRVLAEDGPHARYSVAEHEAEMV